MIFLGAGASSPFSIPTTSTLTTEIHNMLLKEREEDLLNDIITFWKGCYEDKEPNYENILTVLMGLTDARKISKTSVVRAFVKDFPQHKRNYEDIIDNIYSKIVNYCTSPFISGESYIEPMKLETIFQKTYDLFTLFRDDVIFTTNYDPSIEIWCQKRNIQLHDGTEITMNPEIKKVLPVTDRTIEMGATQFELNRRPRQPLQPLSLKIVRLHGSVWAYETAKGQKIKMNRPKDRLLFNDWYSHLDKRPLMIFPGQESILASGEWDVYYQYFKKMLQKTCLVIGYSFNDNLINNVFVDNLKKNQLDKIGIVDPFPDEVMKNLFWNQEVPRNKIVGIPTKFGTDDAINEIYRKWINGVHRTTYSSGIGHALHWKNEKLKEYLE